MIIVLITLGVVLDLVITGFTAYILLLSYSLSHLGQEIKWQHILLLLWLSVIWPIILPLMFFNIL